MLQALTPTSLKSAPQSSSGPPSTPRGRSVAAQSAQQADEAMLQSHPVAPVAIGGGGWRRSNSSRRRG